MDLLFRSKSRDVTGNPECTELVSCEHIRTVPVHHETLRVVLQYCTVVVPVPIFLTPSKTFEYDKRYMAVILGTEPHVQLSSVVSTVPVIQKCYLGIRDVFPFTFI